MESEVAVDMDDDVSFFADVESYWQLTCQFLWDPLFSTYIWLTGCLYLVDFCSHFLVISQCLGSNSLVIVVV